MICIQFDLVGVCPTETPARSDRIVSTPPPPPPPTLRLSHVKILFAQRFFPIRSATQHMATQNICLCLY